MSIKSKIKSAVYLVKSRPLPIEKPIVLQFPVIDICNSRCQMCRIWENKKSNDITAQELRKGLTNPLYSEVRSVGLNGGEPTLRKDLGELTRVLFETLSKLNTVALITNAFKYKEVIARITDVGEVVREFGGHLDVMVSIDGYGDVHDRVRGKPGNFRRAQHVIDFLQSSDLVGTLRIGCTIIRENVYGLADLFEYCQSKGLYIKYRLGVPHQRLYTRDLKEPYALTDEERYHVAEFLEGLIAYYETNPNQNHFYRSLIGQIIHGHPRRAGCDWQHRGATITSKGELLYCAIESNVLGKIQEGESEAMFFGGRDHLAGIIRTKCASCNHDYVGLPDAAEYRRQAAQRLLNKTGLRPVLKSGYHRSGLREWRARGQYEARVAGLTALGRAALPLPVHSGRKVMICGWYGTETLGDKAILAGVGAALTAAMGPIDVTLVSLNPYVSRMTLSQMPELEGWNIVTPEEAAAQVAGMDLLAFGGGPMMAIRELGEMEALFQLARDVGVSTLIAGCGLGPLGEAHLNTAVSRIIALADHRIYRDEKSRKAAAELGINTANDRVAEDPAFTWLASERARTAQLSPPTDRKVVLLGLRAFPWQTYARSLSPEESLEAKARFEREVVAALENLAASDPTVMIRPLPMCTNHFGDDGQSLFQATAQRLSADGYAAPTIITASDFRFIVTEQLSEVGIDPGAVLIEPEGRKTAPAVLAAALFLAAKDPDALLLVAPSDHVIPDANAFRQAVEAGCQAAKAGELVTFGIVPDRPETGYGYLELSENATEGRPIKLLRFVEKPDAAKAQDMLASGRFLWNAGIFLFSAKAIIEAFEAHAANLIPPVQNAVAAAKPDLGFLRLDPEAWKAAENISIDYAVMERADNLTVVPFSAGWSDLGDWNAVWRETGPDENGVTQSGPTSAIDCHNTLLRSENPELELVGIGLENIVAIAMPDAVLVADKSRAQDVKIAVQTLREKGALQAHQFPRDHRPWGWFESLVVGQRFQVKRIVVHPGAALSLQSHVHRSEHWIVVEGTALVTIGDEKKLVTENQSVYIPVGETHRMENPGKVPMVLIEVQTGSYLGEDDIVRYEDVYARG